MQSMLKQFIILVFASLLFACVSTEHTPLSQAPLPTLNTSIFNTVEVPKPEQIFYLSETQKQAFLHYYEAPQNLTVPGNLRLFNYLEKYVERFNFYGVTLNASQALDQKTGNCLTLAIVTKALADLVGLETAFQRVNSAPVYARYSDVMTLSSHVRTYIYEPTHQSDSDIIVIRRASVIIDYFPTSSDVSGYMVDVRDFIAMYYQNLAAEALIKHQSDIAYSLLRQGIALSHTNPDTLNTLAVLFTRMSEQGEAEILYRYMLNNGFATANVIANYAALLQTQGRFKQAKSFAKLIDKIEDDNPYRWIDMADKAFAAGEYHLAEKYYTKANRIAPYLHEGQFGLAKSYYQLGEVSAAKDALTQAIDISYQPDNKRLYQAKLQTLLIEQAY